jgi:phosphoribosylaminoimidazolecarboxamide formyltransferase/IMP cyclohydrolase
MLPRRALISVHDQTNLDDFVQRLLALDVEVVASEDNAAFLKQKGIVVRTIDELVGRGPGFPRKVEALDARVFAGILAAEEHVPGLATIGSGPIDLVAVNLARVTTGPSLDDALAATEIDRPALLRAAATNYARVIVLVDPDDYGTVLKRLIDYDEVPLEKRRELSIRALSILARYDAALGRASSSFDRDGAPRPTPELFTLVATAATELRSGTNAQQAATFYAEEGAPRGSLPNAIMYGSGDAALPRADQLRDSARAMALVAEHAPPTAALLARGRPVSVAVAATISAAVAAVLRSMPPALSSPLLACNTQIDPSTATLLAQAKLATLVAPSLHVQALDVMQAVPDLCIVATRDLPSPTRTGFDVTVVHAGVIAESRDASADGEVTRGKVVTQRIPTAKELRALELAWKVAKHAPSDAIVIAREDDDGTLRTLAIAAAAPSRRRAIDEALALAGPAAAGAALVSDGPIDDLADLTPILDRGVLAVAHPGSARDAENVARSTHVLTMIATEVSHLSS